MDAVIEVQIIGNDSYDSPDRCDCSSRDGFATLRYLFVASKLSRVFRKGDKKESEEILRDAKFSRGRGGGNFYEVSLKARGEVCSTKAGDATESVFRRADGIIVRPLKIESFKTVEIHFLRATRAVQLVQRGLWLARLLFVKKASPPPTREER